MNNDKIILGAYSLLRVVSGLIIFQAGALKILGWYGGMPPDGSTASLATQVGIGGLLELIGGILIILGLFTKPTAFILSGEMAVAYFQFHQPQGFWPIQNNGVSAVLACFIYLYIAARGAGEWSIDQLLRRRKGFETTGEI